MSDLCFEFDNKFFVYRVGALIIRKNKLLMATNPNVTFHYTIGGRLLFGETTEEGVLREIYEEIGLKLEIERLAYINECFYRIGKQKIKAHEIAFYYFIKDNPALDNIEMEYKDGSYNNTLKWFDIADLNKEHIYPEFLQYELLKPQNEIKHIVSRE